MLRVMSESSVLGAIAGSQVGLRDCGKGWVWRCGRWRFSANPAESEAMSNLLPKQSPPPHPFQIQAFALRALVTMFKLARSRPLAAAFRATKVCKLFFHSVLRLRLIVNSRTRLSEDPLCNRKDGYRFTNISLQTF